MRAHRQPAQAAQDCVSDYIVSDISDDRRAPRAIVGRTFMTLGPWVIWVPLLALVNWLVFLAVRGRWGRSALALAVAAVIGIVIGDQVAARTGLEILRVGDMHVLAASVAAQVLMLVVSLLAALGPIRVEE